MASRPTYRDRGSFRGVSIERLAYRVAFEHAAWCEGELMLARDVCRSVGRVGTTWEDVLRVLAEEWLRLQGGGDG